MMGYPLFVSIFCFLKRRLTPAITFLLTYRISISLSILALIALAWVFSWIWQFENLRLYAVTAASGMAVVLVTAAPIFPLRYTWILVLIGGLFTAWVTWYTAADLLKKEEQVALLKDELTKHDLKYNYRIELLRGYYRQLFPNLSENAKSNALELAGITLNTRFDEALEHREERFSDDAVRDLVGILYFLERNNGHALYYSGEMDWHRKIAGRGETQFYTYLEEEEKLAPEFRKSDISVAACRNSAGFCRQRTAWINHLLAIDLYSEALDAKKAGFDSREKLIDALTHVCNTKILYGNFTQFVPTATLEEDIEKLLRDKACRPANLSDYFGSAPFAPSIIDTTAQK